MTAKQARHGDAPQDGRSDDKTDAAAARAGHKDGKTGQRQAAASQQAAAKQVQQHRLNAKDGEGDEP